MYRLLDIIFRIVRSYSTTAYSLPFVLNEVVSCLKSMGYPVTVINNRHRDFKIIQVGGYTYRIIRNRGWLTYDVMIVS